MDRDACSARSWDLDGFEQHLSARSEATRRAYRTDLTTAIEWLGRGGVEAPRDVTRLQLRRYLASLQTRGRSRATIARHAREVAVTRARGSISSGMPKRLK